MAKTTTRRRARPKQDDDCGRIMLPDGRWKSRSWEEDGSPTPDEELWIWENSPHGYPISWRPQKDTAENLSITTRWLQDLEANGLPSRSRRGTKEHCWPDVFVWYVRYQLRQALGKRRPLPLDGRGAGG